MASFNASDFMYGDKFSQLYGLKILNFDSSGLYSGVGSSDVEIYSQQVMRKAKPYYLGRSQSKILQFPLTFGTNIPVTGMERDLIQNWLFGETTYKKLLIVQDDLEGAWFNCFLTNPVPMYIANFNYAFQCTVTCDSPFAYSPLRTVTRTFAGDNIVQFDCTIFNRSSDKDYLYPNLTFELNSVGNSFSLTNANDNDREFLFSNLSPNETITVNNDLQILTSSTGLHRLDSFNKKWFRLVPGTNLIHVESGIGTCTITYYDRKKIGG